MPQQRVLYTTENNEKDDLFNKTSKNQARDRASTHGAGN